MRYENITEAREGIIRGERRLIPFVKACFNNHNLKRKEQKNE
jgi:hypothetical protein